MMATDLYSGNDESTLLQDPYIEEETLSFSELPIYGDSISAEYYSKEDGKKDEDDDDNNLFEFFSGEFTTPSENIVFCGKLIPFKDHQQHVNSQKNVETNTTKRTSSKKGGGISTNEVRLKKGGEEEGKSFASDYTSMGKVSLVRSSATKSRWFVFMFGMSKLSSNEMQLSDIRNRQSRREPATMFPAPEKVVKTEGRRRSNYKGMWKVLRSISLVLGCSSSSSKLANDVVKAAFV